MAVWTRLGTWANARRIVIVIAFGVYLSGCGQQKPAGESSDASKGDSGAPSNCVAVSLDPQLHQPFADATISDPPEDWLRPPDTTLAGKSVGKLYTEVRNHWDEIRFVSPAGKPLAYWAILDNEMGEIEISLRQGPAPNHVRNVVAFAKARQYACLLVCLT